jgi:hypothetical protein
MLWSRVLRAYMAGVAVPTFVLFIATIVLVFVHVTSGLPAEIRRAAVFPVAVVPNVWGFWNVLYTCTAIRRRLSIGFFGALLPFILIPVGLQLAHVLDLPYITPQRVALAFPVAIIVYYLVWKYAVRYLNAVAST